MSISTDTLNSINGTTPTTTTTSNEAGSTDRFLKLLVTQMQNQDPLNPMDNAQITSQMAQISTVDGITALNTTVKGLNSQFMQMQALQGASLVGHNVTVEGNQIAVNDSDVGLGGFELQGAAKDVKVEILDGAGKVVDTLQLGAAASGTNSFQWDASQADANTVYTFRVTATSGTTAVKSTPLMLDYVGAVSMDGSTLNLELARSGTVPYSDVKAFN
jgi:flagellar basal-body rod modification protein FlgD